MGFDSQKGKRITVGLTGIFGSGKSSAARVLESLGARVIDCDQLVRDAYQPKAGLQKKILKAIGNARATHVSSVQSLPAKHEIAEIVFKNPAKRLKLERVIHPYVFHRVSKKLTQFRKGIAVVEMPLLFETGFDRKVDCTAVVLAGMAAIQKRLAKKGFSKQEINLRWRAQWPLTRKRKKGDFIIHNDKDKANLKKQVVKFWELLNKKLAS